MMPRETSWTTTGGRRMWLLVRVDAEEVDAVLDVAVTRTETARRWVSSNAVAT